MISFLISLLALVVGYFIYGKVIEKVFGIDSSRKTPAITRADGVDFIPMPAWKVYMIQFLNIAGTGPIFGAIMGAKFGPASYLWIVLGCIFAGAVHDYMTGMLSIRNDEQAFRTWSESIWERVHGHSYWHFPLLSSCLSELFSCSVRH